MAFGVVAVYLMAWIRIHSWEERTHMFEYGLVAIFIYQALLPNRVYDLRDVGFNALAGLMAVAPSLVPAWAQRRWGKARTD
jgi:hypothetical protein